jgi:2-polyprenyl-6-methoxyphenol hydroxylase-like FAD-dependent oxidoreductase
MTEPRIVTSPETVRFPTDPLPEQVDVLVVGAGPSGLGTALELGRHGVDVAVVDAATEATLARAGAFSHSPRTVEVFRQWGVVDRIRKGWTFPPEWNRGTLLITSLAGHRLDGSSSRGFAPGSAGPYSAERAIRRPQTVLQHVFLGELAARGIPVSARHRLVALRDGADGIEADLESGDGGVRTVRARYVVGADGSRSTVRSLAGITRSGEYATERHFRVVVRTRGDLTDSVGRFPSATNIVYNAEYTGFLAALNATDWRIHVGPFPLDHSPTEEEFLRAGRIAFGSDIELEVASVTPFFKSTRLADRFRHGHVLLVGDAAHVRTPGGNLGEGFGDVLNLGWKLAAVLDGSAGEALLDSYDEERRPHNARVGDNAFRRARAETERWHRIREIGVPDDADLGEEARAARAAIGTILAEEREWAPGVTFDERYDRSSAIWYDDDADAEVGADPWDPMVYREDGRPGHRAPNGDVDPYGDTLYDRIGSHPVLLILSDAAAGVVPGFRAAAEERGIPLDVVHLDEPDARERYGAEAALVRPDHHVAWRSGAVPADPGSVLDRVFGRVSVREPVPVGR